MLFHLGVVTDANCGHGALVLDPLMRGSVLQAIKNCKTHQNHSNMTTLLQVILLSNMYIMCTVESCIYFCRRSYAISDIGIQLSKSVFLFVFLVKKKSFHLSFFGYMIVNVTTRSLGPKENKIQIESHTMS